jgi:hypothetical protein
MQPGSPFQSAAPGLRANGYSIIPLAARSKYPVIDRWSEYCVAAAADEEHARWMTWKAANVGVCLGPASMLVALDLDDDVDGLHGKILSLVPDSPVKKKGAKGFTAFYRFTGEVSKGYSVGGKRVLDVLSIGRQTVLPPSLHPSGGEYGWVTPLTLAEIKAADLPVIGREAMEAIQALFRASPEQRPVRSYYEAYDETTPEDIAEALGFIGADDYDVWIRVGMALKQHLGDAGLAVWDRWSARSDKYDAKAMPGKWRSFRRTDVKISSLFYMAMDRGFVRSTGRKSAFPAVVIEEGGNLRPHKPKAEPALPEATEAAGGDPLDPPGLVGRIARWINETSIYPQPVLAVAASIACVGAVMAHKVQSPTRLRTNFYTLGLAPSGAGKDHARKCVVNLLSYSGLEGLIGGEPASGAGLLTAIREGQGRCIIQWDEFGRVLRSLNNRNAGSHQADIPRMMVELFSCAGSKYQGVQYADHDGKMKRKPIDQPCLSIYGTTVPENFFASITQSDAIDGFLARFLVMESKDYSVKGRKNPADLNDPPEELLAELRRWKDTPSNYNPKGNIDGVLNICPMVVSYTSQAEAMIDEYDERMRERVLAESKQRSGLSPLFARTGEHAKKLALIAHEGDVIGEEAMRWGIAAADWCAEYLARAVQENVSANDFERASKKVMGIIREGGGEWVKHGHLVRRTQELNARQRGEILHNLEESGAVEVDKLRVGEADKPTVFYRAVSAF